VFFFPLFSTKQVNMNNSQPKNFNHGAFSQRLLRLEFVNRSTVFDIESTGIILLEALQYFLARYYRCIVLEGFKIPGDLL
jgi:hypothetical protein